MSNYRITRRATLSTLTRAGALAYFVPAWNETVEAATSCVAATPTVTEGPYWVDEKLFRSDIRTDPTTGVARAGIPLTLNISIQNLSGTGCTPLAGAYVDIWHCDAKGIYSDESTYNPGGGTGNVNTSGQKFLRGYQITDSNGLVTFTTIYPGWYSGRTVHIHFRVRTYSGTTVLGNFVSQIFFDDTVNNTVLAQPAYLRTSSRDTQNSNDMVYNVTNKERMLATVSGDVTAGYTASLTAGVSLSVPAAAAPSISSGGVVNAVGGAAGVASNAWIAIYGNNLSSATRALTASDLVNGVIPTTMSGVSVQIDGKSAFIGYVSPTQINVLAPADGATGSVAVSVSNSSGSSNVTAAMQPVLPGLSTLNSYVRGVRYPDGAVVNGTGAAESGYTTSAAVAPGEIIALYGTGFGAVASGAPSAGTVFSGAYQTLNSVSVTISGVNADVLWAGLVGAGLYQINVRVPSSLSDGDQAVVANVAGLSTQSGALLKVSAAAKTSARLRLRRPVTPVEFERVILLAGVPHPAKAPVAGGELARLSLQAAERQGGIVQVA